MIKTLKKALAIVLALALLVSCVVNCIALPVTVTGLDDADTASYVFTNSDDATAAMTDFDTYATSIGSKILSKSNFSDYFSLDEYGRYAYKQKGSDFWADYNNRIVSLIYNKGIFDDFELSILMEAPEANYGNWAAPQILFGRQSAGDWGTEKFGYATGVTFNVGGDAIQPFYLLSYNNSTGALASYSNDGSDSNFCGACYTYEYKVKVVDGVVTYSIRVPEWGGEPYSETFDISDTYQPGFVGVRFIDHDFTVRSISIKGEASPAPITLSYGDFSDEDTQISFKNDVAVYRGENAAATHSMEPVGFNGYFEFENGFLKRNGGIWKFDDLYLTASNRRTSFFFKAGKFDDFELSFYSYSNDQFGYSIPIIHFGVQDPTKFETTKFGYTANMFFWPNGGAGQVQINKFTEEGSVIKARDTEGNNGIYGNIYGMSYKLTVKNGVATYTISHDWGADGIVTWTTTADLSSEYKAGYVGISFIDGNSCFVNKLTINGSVADNTRIVVPEMKSYGDFNSSAVQNSLKEDFNVYRSESASSTHKLEKVDFANYFSFNANGYLVRNGGIKGFDDLWPTANDRRTNLIYKQSQFKDFEISFYSQSDDQFGYGIPIICFGIKDPTKFATSAAGYTASVAFWPNGGAGRHIISKYNSDGTTTELGADVASNVNDGFNSNIYGYTYNLKVKNGVATFTTTHVWPNLTETHTVEDVELGPDYEGGYIGISFIDADSIYVKNISIEGTSVEDSGYVEPTEDPAGEDDGYTVTPGVYDHFQSKNSRTALKNDFDVYTANNDKCASNGFVKSDFYEDFDFSEEFLKRVSSEPVTFYSYFDSLYTKSTRLMYNKGKFDEFKISIKCVADSGDGANSWEVPSILFGVQDPALYAEKGSGYSAGTVFNPVNYGSFANIAGYSSVDGAKFGGLEPANQNNFSGASYSFEYVLEVKDGKINYTYNKPEWSVSYTYSVDLPADYVPGAIGFQFADVNCIIYDIKVSGTPIAGSVIDTNADNENPEFANKTPVALNGDNFDLLTGGTTNRNCIDFEARFTKNQDNSVTYTNFSDKGFKFGKNNASHTDTLIYSDKQFENFEASVTYKSTSKEIGVPIIFGMTDTASYTGTRGSGFTLNIGAEKIGDNYFVSPNVDGSQVAHSYNKSATTGNKVWGGHDTLNTLTLRVENSIATVTVESEGAIVYSRTLDLWNTYVEGYVGLGFLPNEVTVYDFSIADLGKRDAITVACVGDSITYGDGRENGFGLVRDYTNYPLYLQQLMGDKYYFVNYGVCGATASSTVGNSYRATGFVEESKAINPDVVLLMLGYNDAWNWGVGAPSGVDAKTHFKNEYRAIISGYVNDLPDARIIIATPAFAHGDTTGPDSPTNTAKNMPKVVSAVKELATEFGLEVVDINEATSHNPEWFEDGVHPISDGYKVIASEFAKCLKSDEVLGDTDGDGEITETDINYIDSLLLGCDGFEYLDALDMNDDGVIDVRDAVWMRYLLESSKATFYDISNNELYVSDITFDNDVIINGSVGRIIFSNCTFNAGLYNKGTEDAKVMVLDDCSFGANCRCVIDSTVNEATIDTLLPKFMIFCDAPSVSIINAGAVVTAADINIVVNGVEYPISTADSFYCESTSQMSEYTGQAAQYHNVAKWSEDGVTVISHVAVID